MVNTGPSEAQNVVVTDAFAQVIGAGNVHADRQRRHLRSTCALPANGGFGQASLSNCTLSILPVCRASTDAAGALPLCPVIRVVASHYGDGRSATDHGFEINNTANALAGHAGRSEPGEQRRQHHCLPRGAQRRDGHQESASPASVPVGQLLTLHTDRASTGTYRTA